MVIKRDPKGKDILQVLAVYNHKLAEFKREMENLGVKVEVTASLGIWTSTIECNERGISEC